jgi:hypothetical protein
MSSNPSPLKSPAVATTGVSASSHTQIANLIAAAARSRAIANSHSIMSVHDDPSFCQSVECLPSIPVHVLIRDRQKACTPFSASLNTKNGDANTPNESPIALCRARRASSGSRAHCPSSRPSEIRKHVHGSGAELAIDGLAAHADGEVGEAVAVEVTRVQAPAELVIGFLGVEYAGAVLRPELIVRIARLEPACGAEQDLYDADVGQCRVFVRRTNSQVGIAVGVEVTAGKRPSEGVARSAES